MIHRNVEFCSRILSKYCWVEIEYWRMTCVVTFLVDVGSSSELTTIKPVQSCRNFKLFKPQAPRLSKALTHSPSQIPLRSSPTPPAYKLPTLPPLNSPTPNSHTPRTQSVLTLLYTILPQGSLNPKGPKPPKAPRTLKLQHPIDQSVLDSPFYIDRTIAANYSQLKIIFIVLN